MHSDPQLTVELSRLAFSDIDEMVEWSQGVGWDNIGTQLTPGSNRISFDSLSIPGLTVGHYRVQQSIHNVLTLPEGMMVFMICRTKLPLVWCGRHLPPNLLGVGRAGIEHEVTLTSGWDCYEFMVAEDLIRRTEVFPEAFLDASAQIDKALVPLMEPMTSRFLRQVDAIFLQARSRANRPDNAINQRRLFDILVNGLLQVVDSGLAARGPTRMRRARRPDLVRRSHDYIAAHLTDDLSTEALAQALGVSYRVLHYAFEDSLGVSPYRFMLTQRLHAARRLLKSGDVSVREASGNLGFDNPSRFSRQYERHFGELPSATRRHSVIRADR